MPASIAQRSGLPHFLGLGGAFGLLFRLTHRFVAVFFQQRVVAMRDLLAESRRSRDRLDLGFLKLSQQIEVKFVGSAGGLSKTSSAVTG